MGLRLPERGNQTRRSQDRAGGPLRSRPRFGLKLCYFSWLLASSYLLSLVFPPNLVFLQLPYPSHDLSCLFLLPSLPPLPSALFYSWKTMTLLSESLSQISPNSDLTPTTLLFLFPLSDPPPSLLLSNFTLIAISQPGPDPGAREPGTHPTVSGHRVLKVEHQGPDDAEEEAEHRESDDPPEHGCEAEPEHGPIRVQGLRSRREHPVGSGA